jgi:hypothetical protein
VAERVAKALESIAYTLETFLLPKPTLRGKMKPAGPEALSEFDPEAEAIREEEDERRAMSGMPPL